VWRGPTRRYLNKNGKSYEAGVKDWSECYVNNHVFNHMGGTALTLVEGCGEVPGTRPPWKLVAFEHVARFIWGLLLFGAHAPYCLARWTGTGGGGKVVPDEKY